MLTHSPGSREERRKEPLTARIHPGRRFLSLIPKAPHGKEDIIKSLTESVPSNEKKDTDIIIKFEDKFEDYNNSERNEEIALSLTLCWLYTLDSWVYKQLNEYLRDDSSLMQKMGPIINGLMQSYKTFGDEYYYTGTVYRRSKLSEKAIAFYESGKSFIWSAFTSTTVEFNEEDQFGDILFEINIPEDRKQFALYLENISSFPLEREVLLLPNVGYTVKSILKGDEINSAKYPKVKIIIYLDLLFFFF